MPSMKRIAALLVVIAVPITALGDPIRTSTLGWMIDGTVSEVARAGDVAYVGGSFRTVAPSANRVFNNATFSTRSAVPVLPRLQLNGSLRAVVRLGNGGWIVGGDFTRVGSATRNRLARLLPNGSLDSAFNVSVDGEVLALAASGSTLFVGGQFNTVGGSTRQGLAAIDLAGPAVLPAFAPDVPGAVFDLLIDGTSLLVAGDFMSVSSTARPFLAKVDASTGAVVTAFNANADASVNHIAKSGSNYFVSGEFNSIGGLTRRGVAKLDATTGGAVSAFNAQMSNGVKALAVGASTVYIGGLFTQAGGASRMRLAGLDLVTGLATPWNPGADGDIEDLALSGTTLFAAGSFEEIADTERLYLASFDTTRTTDSLLGWNPALNRAADMLHAEADGLVFVAGSFTAFGAIRRDNLAAIDLQRGDLLPWNPGTNGWVRALDVHRNLVYIGGDFTTIAGMSRSRIAAIDALTGRATTWNPRPDAPVKGLMVSGDTVFFVGEFSNVQGPSGSLARGHGAAAALDGTIRPWNPDADNTIETLMVDTSRVYIAGSFTDLNGSTHNRLAAVNMGDGAALSSFNPTVNAVIYRLDVHNGVVYFGGAFSTVNGSSRNNAAAVQGYTTALNPPTPGTLLAWAPDVNGPIYDLDAFEAAVYLAGGFGAVDGESRPGIAMVDANPLTGTLRSWRPTDVQGGQISVIDTSADAVLFGGNLYDLDGISIGAVLYPEAGRRGVPRPPTTPDVRLNNGSIEITWTRPPLGTEPTTYLIEGGSGPGQRDLANVSTGSPDTSFAANGLPAGTYYLRMRSGNAFGIGEASEEQAFTIGGVGCSAPPESPLDLTATVTGNSVAFNWRAPAQSIVTSYVIRAGSMSGARNLATLPVGNVTSFTVTAPTGAFFVTVGAVNGCGAGVPSHETVVVVGGAVVPPGRPIPLESEVTGQTVTLSWAEPSIGTGPFQYVLEVGSAPGASNLFNAPMAGQTTITANGVAPGIYYIRVRAIGVGGVGPASNEVVVVVN
jgi:hypothetical protein